MDASKSWETFVASPNEEKFSAIYTTHGTMVWSICHRILGPSEEVDDAFQGTWIRLLVAVRDQQEELTRKEADLVLARLAALEANRVRQKRNRLHQREVAMDPLPEQIDNTADGIKAASREELAAMVEAAMAEQPEIYSKALELHYLDGLTQQQVATVLQLPLGTVATRLKTGRTRLIAALKRAGIANGGAALVTAGAMVVPITLPAASTVYTSASAASAALPPAVVDFSLLNGKATFALLSTKSALIATLCLIPLVIAMVIYFQPPSRLDAYTEVAQAETEEVALSEPVQEEAATPPIEEPIPTPTATPAADVAETEGMLTVEGVVYTEQRELVPAAQISLYTLVIGGDLAPYEWRQIASTESDKEGVYRLSIDDEKFFLMVTQSQNFSTEVLIKSNTAAYEMENYQPRKRKERVNIILHEGRQTTVSVRNEVGEPIAGAFIHLLHPMPNSSIFYPEAFSSNELGMASIGRLTSKRYELWVMAEGFESKQLNIVPTKQDISVTLKAGTATLGGFVRHAETGEPIAGVAVRAALRSTLDEEPRSSSGTEMQNSANMLPYRQGTTGTDGSYELSLPPGNYYVSPVAEGLKVITESGLKENETKAVVNGDRILDYDFKMGSSVQLVRGRITEMNSGDPLPEVLVTIDPSYKRIYQLTDAPETYSDSKGRFELKFSTGMIMAGFFEFKKDGFKVDLTEPLELKQEADGVYTMDINMTNVRSRQMLIVNKDNLPVGGAQILARISPIPYTNSSTLTYGVTDESGLASIAFPKDSFSTKFHIQHPDGFSFVVADLTEDDLMTSNPTRIIVPDQLSTSFQVVDADQNPIPAAQVRLLHRSFSNIDAMADATNLDGRLDVQQIVPDFYIAVTSAPGFVTKQDVFDIRIDSKNEQPRTIALDSSHAIKGRVIDSSGRPLEGVEVSIRQGGIGGDYTISNIDPSQVTNSKGLFSFTNIPYTKASLTFRHDEQSQPYAAKFGEDIHDYIINPESFILFVGVVVDAATGEAVEDFNPSISLVNRTDVDLQDMGQYAPSSKRLPNGTFTYEINTQLTSRLNVIVDAPGYAVMESPAFPVEAGKNLSHIFEMTRGTTVTGRVITEEGEPVRRSHVAMLPVRKGIQESFSIIFSGHHQRFKPVLTDTYGRFSFEHIAPGENRIVAEPSGNYRQGELFVTVLDGQASQHVGDLVVTEGDVLKGVVLQLPDRLPIPNVEVKASVKIDMRSPWEQHRTMTDKHGEFTFEGLSQGKTSISVFHMGSRHGSTKEAKEWGFAEFLIGTESVRGKATLDGAPHQFQVTAKSDGRHDVHSRTGSGGDFTLTGLQSGSYTITVRCHENDYWERSIDVTVPTSEPVLIDIVTQQLHGRLLDADGVPVEGVQLTVINLRNDDPSYAINRAWAKTNADGSFTLEGVGPGRHKLRTYYNGAYHDLAEFEISLGIDKNFGDLQLP